jgi:hypothetical protein
MNCDRKIKISKKKWKNVEDIIIRKIISELRSIGAHHSLLLALATAHCVMQFLA